MRYIRPINNDLDFFENGFDEFFKPVMPKQFQMNTDIKETQNNFIMDIDIPGFKKDEISIDFEEGYLTITANKELTKTNENKENKQQDKYIKRERYTGRCSRKFYIGDINENDIKANFENGVLTVAFPKESKKLETKKQILIN